MPIQKEDIIKLANLSRLKVTEEEMPIYLESLSNTIKMISNIQNVDTSSVKLNHLNGSQRLREDVITEKNQRELFQSLSKNTLAGLYLVPQVIDSK